MKVSWTLLALGDFDFTFSATDSTLLAAALLAAVVLVAFSGYFRFLRRWRKRSAWIMASFRAAAVLVAALLLLGPALGRIRVSSEKARVAVLLDTSQSMAFSDEKAGATRLEEAKRILFQDPAGLAGALEQRFELDLYCFGETTRRLDPNDPPHLEALDARTDLGGALGSIIARYDTEHLAALLLLTDGRENGETLARDLAERGTPPIHVVGLGFPEGSPRALPDAVVDRLVSDAKVLQGDRLEIIVEGKVAPPANLDALRVELLVDGHSVETQTVPLPAPGIRKSGEVPFRLAFSWKAGPAGPRDIGAFIQPFEGEKFIANNRLNRLVEVSAKRIELLIYESRPRWEYKFLRKSLAMDPNIRLTSLVRTGPGHYLKQGESPVDLSQGLSESIEVLGRFDCILLGVVLEEDFGPRVIESLRRYVEEGVGGLILLAGTRSLGVGGLFGTPLERALPVHLTPDPVVRTGRFPLRIPASGAAHPILKDFQAPIGPGRSALHVETLYETGPLKPGGQVLAAADVGAGSSRPLLVVQRYGEGKCAVVLTDATWKWAMDLSAKYVGEGPHPRFWGRLVRWVSGREEIEDETQEEGLVLLERTHLTPGDRTTLIVANKTAGIKGSIEDEKGERKPLVFKETAGGSEAEISPATGGFHRIRIEDKDGSILGTVKVYVDRDTRETEKTTQDRALLRRLAAATAGAYYTPAETGRIPSAVLDKAPSFTERKEWRLEDGPWAFLAIVLLLGFEWVLRRRAGTV